MGVVDLTSLDFSLTDRGSGSAGSFYKAVDSYGNYYKASYMLKDEFGFESINEVLASRLASLLGYKNVGYNLVLAKFNIAEQEYVSYLCTSSNFKQINEARVTLETFSTLHDLKKGVLDSYKSCIFYNDLLNMLFFDYLIDNRDRHGSNIELLYRVGTGCMRLAPIYDCGSSLLAPMQYNKSRIDSFEYLHDGPVNNFLVSVMWHDVLDKLKSVGFIVPNVDLSELYYTDLYRAFPSGYEFILDKEIEMIRRRYYHVKKIFNS